MQTPEARIKAATGRNESLIIAGEYSDVRKYAWIAPKKPQIKAVPRRQLPQSDMDELARLREMSAAQVEKQRFPDQDSFEDAERQLGKPMHSGELIAKVLKLNRRLFCEDSINCRGHAAFYYYKRKEKTATGASFKKGILSEFSNILPDAAGLPIGIQYGWREVLLRLVKAKQLSLKQVLRVFGDTATVQSSNWRRDIQQFRT